MNSKTNEDPHPATVSAGCRQVSDWELLDLPNDGVGVGEEDVKEAHKKVVRFFHTGAYTQDWGAACGNPHVLKIGENSHPDAPASSVLFFYVSFYS
jgi:hypothetical protein